MITMGAPASTMDTAIETPSTERRLRWECAGHRVPVVEPAGSRNVRATPRAHTVHAGDADRGDAAARVDFGDDSGARVDVAHPHRRGRPSAVEAELLDAPQGDGGRAVAAVATPFDDAFPRGPLRE